ncbi:MAG: hypothetical protein UR15_C0001G0016 [Parcubacteria group bacterium GW2011_GWA2_31_28]|nr:MAG: hypothetical protein UR15_C0001G0016 [Parcubacteria group bacterium GW2011_GWA2_31_28]
MEIKKALQILVYGIILIALIGVLIGLSSATLDNLINLFISAVISLFLSAVIGGIIELFSDDTLKEIFWTIDLEIWDFEIHVPISLFTILTIVIKLWWFG